MTAVSAFAGDGTAFVRTVYDQSGGGNHMIQTSTGNQPFFHTGTDGPTVMLTGGGYFRTPLGLIADRRAVSTFAVLRDTRQSEGQAYWYFGTESTTDLGLAGNTGGQFGVLPYTTADGPAAISPNDGRTDATCSACILGFTSAASGIVIHRDDATATSPAVMPRPLNAGGFYGRTGAVIARQDFFAFVFYPAGLSAADAATLKAYLAPLYKTNAFRNPPLNLAMQGDSKTYGMYTPFNATITRQLDQSYAGAAMVRNFGIPGNTIRQDLGNLLLVGTKYLEPARTNIAIISEGGNDLLAGRTASQVWADYMTACAALRAGGWARVVATTITPVSVNANGVTPAVEAQRVALNAMIIANAGGLFDAVANYNTIPQLGADGAPNLAYLPDGLHETEAAYALELPVLKAAIEAARAA